MRLSAVLWIVAEIVLHTHPGFFRVPGAHYLPPSGAERAEIVARHLVPLVAGAGFLIVTWRQQHQGRALATWSCAIGTIVVAVTSWFG